jgi:Rab-like protein 2
VFKHTANIDGKEVSIDFWDTAGQERFERIHSSYYHRAHACVMVFDVTRKDTYVNLAHWYRELQQYRKGIPILVVANKIDVNPRVTSKPFQFTDKRGLPKVRFCSASDGTNVVSVFEDIVQMAYQRKLATAIGGPGAASGVAGPVVGDDEEDFVDEVLAVLDYFDDKDKNKSQ